MTKSWSRALIVLLIGFAPVLAQPQCARPLQIPVAPIGFAVTVVGQQVGGIYPDLLRVEAAKAGCTVEFQVVPRSRQEMLFEIGLADLLIPARRSARRDEYGIFVPMILSRAELLCMQPRSLTVHSLAELLDHRELRVGVVRGYDYDASYQSLLKQLLAQSRLTMTADPVSLARMLDTGAIDLAVVTPTAVTGALRGDSKWGHLIERLRSEPVEELSWAESGAYVARHSSLNAADRQRVRAMLQNIDRSGAAWREFQHYYPERNLSDSVRAR